MSDLKALNISRGFLTLLLFLVYLTVHADGLGNCIGDICFSSPEKSQQILIAPYLYGPDINGNAEVEGMDANFDYSVEELASGINAGGMGYLVWERGSDFFYMEGLGFRYKDRINAFQDKLLSAEIALLELGYGRNYCTGITQAGSKCALMISPYIGLRHTRMNIAIKLNEGGLEAIFLALAGLPNVYQADERWLDPAVGIIIKYDINTRLKFYTKGDIAGLGIGYNDYWNFMSALYLQATEHWNIAAGYRVSDFDATPGGGNKLKLTLHGAGPIVGIVYNF
ncbi:hypothetical protein [Zhongshania sp. BJYM1]|uniref:hypothetical protein n=1 Tax=Zhongshania aquatica TaxID=2965069 RepID=UPI0022B37E0B|nr:hypothetical protein [Marortus sp. BJYM1]